MNLPIDSEIILNLYPKINEKIPPKPLTVLKQIFGSIDLSKMMFINIIEFGPSITARTGA
jgi:hypothetical protein